MWNITKKNLLQHEVQVSYMSLNGYARGRSKTHTELYSKKLRGGRGDSLEKLRKCSWVILKWIKRNNIKRRVCSTESQQHNTAVSEFTK
jgi:hypothetical protein